MIGRNRVYILVLLLIVLTIIGALSLQGIFLPILSLTVSLLALFFSVVSAWKNEIFPFRLSIFTDSLHLVAVSLMKPLSGIGLIVLLPITFFNRGYSEGIIEATKLIVKGEQSGVVHDFLPSFEVDMEAFIQQGKGLNQSNSLGVFTGFLLESKHAIKKNIVFTPKVIQGDTQFVWRPDTYTFEIYVKVYGEKKSKKYFELKQKIDNNSLTMLVMGKTQALFFYSDTND